MRFNAVYVGHFKCKTRRIVDYSDPWVCVRNSYQPTGIADTVQADNINHHRYASQAMINPTGIVPAGPRVGFTPPHGRG